MDPADNKQNKGGKDTNPKDLARLAAAQGKIAKLQAKLAKATVKGTGKKGKK